MYIPQHINCNNIIFEGTEEQPVILQKKKKRYFVDHILKYDIYETFWEKSESHVLELCKLNVFKNNCSISI